MGAASVIAQFNGSVTFKTVATLLLRALRQNDIGGELADTSNLRQICLKEVWGLLERM